MCNIFWPSFGNFFFSSLSFNSFMNGNFLLNENNFKFIFALFFDSILIRMLRFWVWFALKYFYLHLEYDFSQLMPHSLANLQLNIFHFPNYCLKLLSSVLSTTAILRKRSKVDLKGHSLRTGFPCFIFEFYDRISII